MNDKRVAILISGGGSNMVALVQAMQAEDFPAKPVLVLANEPDAGGLAKAESLGVATTVVDHRNFAGDRPSFEQAMNAELEKVQPDVVCFAGFMRITTENFVRSWQGRLLNIHPSLLPKYPGLNTHQRALDAGDSEAGCTVHEVTEVLDDGPILGQATVPILSADDATSLAARVLEMEHKLYPKVLRRFCAGERGIVSIKP